MKRLIWFVLLVLFPIVGIGQVVDLDLPSKLPTLGLTGTLDFTGTMDYGIDFSLATVATAEFVLQNGATIDNIETDTLDIEETVIKVDGELTVTGDVELKDTVTQSYTTTANGYTAAYQSEWTAGADMAAGGSNGIYSISNPVKDVQNAYALRGRLDLQDATEAIDVNQIRAVDALINLNETYDYDVDGNITVVGASIHGGGTNDITTSGDGSLNLFYGVWGPTTTKDFAVGTNGYLLTAHAGTYVDNGFMFSNSGASTAGLYLRNHASNSPSTMTNGILMESAAGKMTYGINMTGAGITTAEVLLQNSATIDNTEADTLAFTEKVLKFYGQEADFVFSGDDDGLFWKLCHVNAGAAGTFGSNATMGAEGATSYWLLDATTEFAFFDVCIHDDWDGDTDIWVKVRVALNGDETANDDIDATLVTDYYGDHEDMNTGFKTQTRDIDHDVGNFNAGGSVHDLWFQLDHDLGGNVIEVDDILNFKFYLDDISTGAPVIAVRFLGADVLYRTKKPKMIYSSDPTEG